MRDQVVWVCPQCLREIAISPLAAQVNSGGSMESAFYYVFLRVPWGLTRNVLQWGFGAGRWSFSMILVQEKKQADKGQAMLIRDRCSQLLSVPPGLCKNPRTVLHLEVPEPFGPTNCDHFLICFHVKDFASLSSQYLFQFTHPISSSKFSLLFTRLQPISQSFSYLKLNRKWTWSWILSLGSHH